MNKYMLRLLPDGDIDIISDEFAGGYTIVYHKTYNPGDNLKENLMNAYEEWKKLTEAEKGKIKWEEHI